MKVFVLLDELFALVHIFGFEKIVELALQFFHNSFNSGLDLFAIFYITVLDLFLQLKHIKHEATVIDLGLFFDVYPSDFHHVNCSF